MEDFAPYELAVKLKKKGFNWRIGYAYGNKGEYMYTVTEYDVDYIPAPTISQVLKWLRKEKNVFIEISITTSGYYSTVYSNIDLTLVNKTTYYQEYVGATNEDYNNCVLEAIEYVLDNLI